MIVYEPHRWFWIAADRGADTAWSSAANAWVPASDAPPDRLTRIPSVAELDAVLRARGLPGPVATAADVRAEASRRMSALLGARDAAHLDILIANGTREAIRLLRIREDRPWTPEESAREATLRAVDAAIEAIRAASNALETNPPADYRDDAHWPRLA